MQRMLNVDKEKDIMILQQLDMPVNNDYCKVPSIENARSKVQEEARLKAAEHCT